jgi:hypothetical protein
MPTAYIVPPFIDRLIACFGDIDTAGFLQAIFNPSRSVEIRQLITVHGEHIPTLRMPDIPDLKFCMTYLAACGTVNWADDGVNAVILKQYEELLKESGLMQLKTFPGATPDIYHFVLAIRLAHRLEKVDKEHDKRTIVGEALSAGSFSRYKNFSVTRPTRPTFDTAVLNWVIDILSKEMKDTSNNDELIRVLTRLNLPTAGYYLKRYSLGSRMSDATNEHGSWVVNPAEGSVNDKGYEHKASFFEPFTQPAGQQLTTVEQFEAEFTSNIANTFTSYPALNRNLSIANIPRSIDTRSDDEKSKKVSMRPYPANYIGGSVQLKFSSNSVEPHLHDEINYGSPTWNKLVITVKQGELPFSTVVQWKINLRDGPTGKEAELAFNAWNIVASRPGMGGRLSETGQENYIVTTVELNLFAKMLGATHTTGCDVTCSVIGGKRVSGWPVLNVATWTDYTSKQQSNLLFLHPPTIPGVVGCQLVSAGHREFHPPCDLRKNTYNMLTSAAIIFDTITAVEPTKREQWKSSFKRGLDIVSDGRLSRHSVNIRDEFYAVLQLFDALSKSDSTENTQLAIHPKIKIALQKIFTVGATAHNLSMLDITTVDQLLQGIWRYLRHVTDNLYGEYKRYTQGNLAAVGNVMKKVKLALALDDNALTSFFEIINALKLSFFSFQFKPGRLARSDNENFEDLKKKILQEARKNAADDLNQDDKISEHSEQLYALPYLSSDVIEEFLNSIRQLFGLSTDDKQADLVDDQLLDVISNIIIPGLRILVTNPDSDQVSSVSGGTRRRRYSKRRRTNRNNRNKSPRRRSRYSYNNKNKKSNKNNKKKPNRTRRRT